MSSFHQIVEKSEKVLIMAHQKPDGDAIGSCFALYHALKKMGKEVAVLQNDSFPQNLLFLKKDFFLCDEMIPFTPDTLMVLDCADKKRAAGKMEDFKGAFVVNIDHHHTNPGYGDLAIVDSYASSTAEVIYYLLVNMVEMDREIAKGIYVGIATDTNRFYYDSTGVKTLQAVESLMKYIDLFQLNTLLYGSKPYSTLRLQSYAIENIQFFKEGRIAFLEVPFSLQQELQSFDTDDLVELLRDIQGVELSVLLYEFQGKVKASLRSKVDELDVSKIASDLGGGGHKKAAGVTFDKEDFSYQKKKILEILENLSW